MQITTKQVQAVSAPLLREVNNVPRTPHGERKQGTYRDVADAIKDNVSLFKEFYEQNDSTNFQLVSAEGIRGESINRVNFVLRTLLKYGVLDAGRALPSGERMEIEVQPFVVSEGFAVCIAEIKREKYKLDVRFANIAADAQTAYAIVHAQNAI